MNASAHLERGFPTAPDRLVRIVGAVVAATLCFATLFAAFAPHAAAQEDASDQDAGDTSEPVEPGEDGPLTEVRGTLKVRATEPGEDDQFISGVNFIVSDAEGNEIGLATTDENGEWSLVLPGAGDYNAFLDESTLPEGLPLKNPENNPLNFSVNAGDSRPTLFPLGEEVVSQDSTIQIVQLTVDGIKFGLIIAMSAIGLSLIYGTTGLTNFAHGEMVTLGAIIAHVFNVSGFFGWTTSIILAGILTTIICGFTGGLFNQLVWQPLRRRGASLIAALVVSIGFSILARYVMVFFFKGRVKFYRDYQLQPVRDFGWFSISPKDIVIIVISVVVLVAVGLALQTTRMGKAMRAVADNRDLAESSGIDVDAVIRWVWVAGGALAGLGGVLFGLTESIGWEMGFRLLLLMFAGVTLGGLGTAYGALFGSLIIGILIQWTTLLPEQIITPDQKNIGALLMLTVILLIRPQGLLGRAERIG